jgi:hypothetical protein
MQTTLDVLQQDVNVVGGVVAPCDAAGSPRS